MTDIVPMCYVHFVIKSSQPLSGAGPLITPFYVKQTEA